MENSARQLVLVVILGPLEFRSRFSTHTPRIRLLDDVILNCVSSAYGTCAFPFCMISR